MNKLLVVTSAALLAGTAFAWAQGTESSGNSTNSNAPTMKNSPSMSQTAPNAKGAGGGATAEDPNDPKNDNRVGDVNTKTPAEAVQKGDRAGGN
jgi:hypothetical protein